MDERDYHTYNEDNNIIDDDDTKNILTATFDAHIPLDDKNGVGQNQWRINDDCFF